MKRFIFTGIIILFVMAGCGGDHSSTDGLITVDVNDSYSTKKELVLQDFMDVEYIPLETNDEFINRACVQAVGEKYIIVTNFYDDGNIFVYGRNGKAIRKINRKGQGGEEYVSMRSIVPIQEIGWASPDTTPTHIILRFSSGHGGAYIGAPDAKFWIDNVKLVY